MMRGSVCACAQEEGNDVGEIVRSLNIGENLVKIFVVGVWNEDLPTLHACKEEV
jgi:hypothetical protein